MNEKEIKNPSLVINGGKKIEGEVVISGDKISAVHLLFASVLPDTKTLIKNMNFCGDAVSIISWLEREGIAEINYSKKSLIINPKNKKFDITNISKSRASICLVLGSALKFGQTKIGTNIGGCCFTDRGIDRHLELIKTFGISIQTQDNEYIVKQTKKVNNVFFDCSTKFGPSVGVTAHALIASLVFKGEIILENIALEPVTRSLIEFVQECTGKNIICKNRMVKIFPVKKAQQSRTEINLKYDTTEALTFIAAAMATKGNIELVGVKNLLPSVRDLMNRMGVRNIETKKGLQVNSLDIVHPHSIVCEPWPGIPSDIGPILSAGLCMHSGFTRITDKVYNSRATHIDGLNKMGFHLKAGEQKIYIAGQSPTKHDVSVKAIDIRAGAALLIGALARSAETTINEAQQIFRGYQDIIASMRGLGADIRNGEKK